MTEQMPSTPELPESPAPAAPTPENQVPQSPVKRRGSGGMVWGAILILIGAFALVEQIFHLDFGLYFLPLLGVIFLLAGILGRKYGLLIPGGILAGLGVGTLLVEGPFKYLGNSQASSGVFMLAFAGGWLVITLAALLINRVILWPLIPGAFLGLFGVALLGARTGLFSVINQGWPIILIAIGLYLVLRRRELTK